MDINNQTSSPFYLLEHVGFHQRKYNYCSLDILWCYKSNGISLLKLLFFQENQTVTKNGCVY